MEIISEEEKRKQMEETKQSTGFFSRVVRIVVQNPDLVVLFFLVVSVLGVGWCVARFYFGMTTSEVKLYFSDMLEFIGFALIAIASFFGKLYTKQGTISKTLSSVTDKKADISGRSIVE